METKPLRYSSQHHGLGGQFGIARVDITPAPGIYARNWGAALHDVATAIHRPLTLTALVIAPQSTSERAQQLVYLDADLGWWKTPQTYQRFMDRLRSRTELAEHQLIFALSHTHAGPPLMHAEAELPGSDPLNAWMEELLEKSVTVIGAAQQSLFPGLLEWAVGRCSLAANRDLPEPVVGSTRVICGLNPSLPADDTLLVARLSDSHGRTRGTLTNYACHPTTLAWDNHAISPDYIGAMRATVEQATQAPALFMLGACGDLAPRLQYVGEPAVADRHGRQLAYATLAVLENMEAPGRQLAYTSTVESGAPLAVWRECELGSSSHVQAEWRTVALPLKDWPTADELEGQRAACTDRALEERLRRKRDIRRGVGDEATFDLPIYAWRLGEAVVIGTCCEPYSLLQLELRRRFADRIVVCMNLINGSIGYLPPAEKYDSDVYPVWQTPFDRGSFERTLDAMTELLQHVIAH
jgi:hypothetical protein